MIMAEPAGAPAPEGHRIQKTSSGSPPGSRSGEILPEWAWRVLIIASTAAVLLFSVYCLSHGITIIFMHLYYFPIVLLAYRYRYRGFVFATLLAIAYVGLVYFYDLGQVDVVSGAWYRFIVFIGIAAVVAYLSERLVLAQKATEKAAEVKERYLSLAPAIVLSLDARGAITLLNDQGCIILECRLEEVIGKPWFDLFIPEKDRDRVREFFRQMVAGQVGVIDHPVLTCSGAEMIVRWHITVLHDENGTINGTLSFGEDITRRKKAEEAVRKSREYLDAFIRTAQYIPNLTSQQDILNETGRVLVSFFGADLVGFFEPGKDGGIDGHHWILPEGVPATAVLTKDTETIIAGVLETGFLAAQQIEIPEPFATVFLPILWENQTTAVMLIGHQSSEPIPKELLDIYLAVAGLVTNAITGADVEFRNIAARKRAEEALEAVRAQLAFLVSNTPVVLYRCSASGDFKVTFISDNVRLQLGYEAHEFTDDPSFWPNHIHSDDRKQVFEVVPRLIEKRIASSEYRFLAKDGTYHWTRDEVRAVRDAEGEPVEYLGYWIDITERKKAEEALRLQNQIFGTIAEGVYLIRVSDGVIVYTNAKFEKMFGYEKGELIGKQVSVVNAPEEKSSPQDTAEAIMKALTETGEWRGEVKNIRKDGSTFWCLAVVSTFEHPEFGSVWISAHTDITKRKEAEEALQMASKKVSMLSSITRHDIRNQLMALRTYLELSKEDVKDPVSLNYIEKEDQVAEAIRRQIEFTQYYENIGVNAPEWQEIPQLILSGKTQLQELEKIRINVDIPAVQIYADALIEKVFYNLMENSLRHGVSVTRINFSFKETGSGAVITYEDNGVGIPQEDKTRLFQKGFGKHTGLGLFLSQEILAITGLTIRESGEPGKGVRFEIIVPDKKYRFPGKNLKIPSGTGVPPSTGE